MGNAKQWIEVALGGGFGVASCLCGQVTNVEQPNIRPYLSFFALSWGLVGLWFGLVSTFGWQAIRSPLVVLVMVAFAGSVITVVLGRPKSQESSTR